jgi:hypothetical protein
MWIKLRFTSEFFAQLCTPGQRDKRSERVEEAARRLDSVVLLHKQGQAR